MHVRAEHLPNTLDAEEKQDTGRMQLIKLLGTVLGDVCSPLIGEIYNQSTCPQLHAKYPPKQMGKCRFVSNSKKQLEAAIRQQLHFVTEDRLVSFAKIIANEQVEEANCHLTIFIQLLIGPQITVTLSHCYNDTKVTRSALQLIANRIVDGLSFWSQLKSSSQSESSTTRS